MEQKYVCPACKSILLIDGNNNGDIKCPNCGGSHNFNEYTRVFTIDYQCKNSLCNLQWVVASRQNNSYSNHYVCPTCRCVHIGQINHSIKEIKCPNCKFDLIFAIEPGKEPSQLSCPYCNQTDLYNNFFSPNEVSLPPFNAETISFRLELINDRQEKGKGLYGHSKAIEFSIKEGEQLRIGRKSEGSLTEIQIPTNDDIMSRNHLSVTIENTNEGYKLKITDSNSANGTCVNSKIIPKNVPITLNDNDTIRMGKSVFTIKKIVRPPIFNNNI